MLAWHVQSGGGTVDNETHSAIGSVLTETTEVLTCEK